MNSLRLDFALVLFGFAASACTGPQAAPEDSERRPQVDHQPAAGKSSDGELADVAVAAAPSPIECISVSRPPTGDLEEDILGTWVTDFRMIDSPSPVIRFMTGGHAELVTPAREPHWMDPYASGVRPVFWSTTGDTLSIESLGEYTLWAMNPSAIQFQNELDNATFFRVDCKGSVFGEDFRELRAGCADEPQICESLEIPGTCLEQDGHWGVVSACGYENIPPL